MTFNLEDIQRARQQLKPSQWIEKMLSDWHIISDYAYKGGVQVPRTTLFTLPEFKDSVENELMAMVPAVVDFQVKYVTKKELNDIRSMT